MGAAMRGIAITSGAQWGGAGWARGWAGRAVAAATATLAAERDRWALWLPVALGFGIAVYFSLPAEPPITLGPAAAVAAALAWWFVRRRGLAAIAALAVTAIAVGFAAAQLRTAGVAAPVLAARIGPVAVTGVVAEVERRVGDFRLLLDAPRIQGHSAETTPARVRVRVSALPDGLRPGDTVALRAVLTPPPGPSAPGAFDFARRAFFDRIGGVGFAVGTVRLIERSTESGLAIALARARQSINEQVWTALPGATGAMAAALMTGERSTIPADVLKAMQDSGLAHLLAISGLNIGLVAGILLFSVRLAMASSERLALNYPIKKWATVVAMVGAAAYFAISVGSPPIQRAFLMLSLMMLAVLLDRTAISMRMVAWAAGLMLVLAPESLTNVSFQMSFAAVVALVAAYEFASGRMSERRAGMSRGRRLALYFAGVMLSTVVATLATAPFAVYHFNRLALYAVLSNLVAVPVTAFWIMPWSMLAFALMPFGWEWLALQPMGWGIEAVVAVARATAELPGAVALVPAMPIVGLALMAVGGLWLCLWRRKWRALGLVGVLAGVVTLPLARGPDVLVDATGRLVAVRGPDGRLAVSSTRLAPFTRDMWLRHAGQDEAVPWPADGVACDGLGCLYRARGQVVALIARAEAISEDCAGADVVIAAVPVGRRCTEPRLVIDRFDLWRNGAHALWLDAGGVRVETVVGTLGDRPWVTRPRPAGRPVGTGRPSSAASAQPDDPGS